MASTIVAVAAIAPSSAARLTRSTIAARFSGCAVAAVLSPTGVIGPALLASIISTGNFGTFTALLTWTRTAPALAASVVAGITELLTEVILTAIIAAFATADLTTIIALVRPWATAAPLTALVTPFVAIAALVTATAVPSILATLMTPKVSLIVTDGTPPPAVRRGAHAGRRMIS